jgi:hypothetical protein
MNKKILFFAFISAAFFFNCSADGFFESDTPPPEGETSSPQNPSGGGGGAGYCLLYDDYEYEYYCVPIPPGYTEQSCREADGQPVNSCGNY